VLVDRTASASDLGEVERVVSLDNLPGLLGGSPIV
jgi:hypothetical protein